MNEFEEFEEGQAYESPKKAEHFIVELEGFEGPADVLLAMARDQKVDIAQISILELANQYLAFIDKISTLDLELAADYLVMAAWLAYFKSKLLLPELEDEDEPSGAEMAAALKYQLQRLEAMQHAGSKLMERPRLGIDFFARGNPELFQKQIITSFELSLHELLQAYGDHRSRKMSMQTLKINTFEIFSVERAMGRLRKLLSKALDWKSLWKFLPKGLKGSLVVRSAVASTFAATLELAREGKTDLEQSVPFGPIHIRKKNM